MSEPAYPAKDIAALLLLTPQRVNQLAAEGVFTKDRSGKFPLVATIQSYLNFKLKDDGSIAAAKLRKERAEASIAERRDTLEAGELTPTANAARVLEEICASMRQTVSGSPDLTPVLRSKLLQTLEIDINDAILRAETGNSAADSSAPDQASRAA